MIKGFEEDCQIILKNVLLKDERQYESRIVDSEEEVIRLTNRSYDCQLMGVNTWLMKRKNLVKRTFNVRKTYFLNV